MHYVLHKRIVNNIHAVVLKMKKVSLIAVAVTTALTSGFVVADTAKGTDILTDGWEIHGYMSSNYRLIDGSTSANEFGKPDYKTAGTHSKNTNQVELTVNKKTTFQNGVYSNFVLRSEFGNGNSFAYSSSGSQKQVDDGQFEVKEAFIELGGMNFLGKDTSIWAGQRFLNRSAGLLSGEFWKQSSGVGAGIESKLMGNKAGFAVVSADTDHTIVNYPPVNNDARRTLTSFDFYYYGVDVGFGSLDFDYKYMYQDNPSPGNTRDGHGLSVTLNTSYYGLDGWSQTAIAYGKGIAQNRGVNFGGWSGGSEKSESLFATSYGVWNVTDRLQFGSEVTYIGALDELWGAKDLKRLLVAGRPSYKVNDNLRLEMTASYGFEDGQEGYWGRTGDAVESNIFNLELATAFTVNADYFGRPQIKPYVSYVAADDVASAKIIGIDDGEKDEVIFGVHAELWF